MRGRHTAQGCDRRWGHGKGERVRDYRTIQDLVTDRLRREILDGTFPAGTRLNQDEIAEAYEVSRMPVRQAMLTLESEGLVLRRPRRGAEVAAVDAAALIDLADVRALLEGRAIELAVPHQTAAHHRIADEAQQALAVESDWRRREEYNACFHDTLYEASGRSVLLEQVRSMRARLRPYRAAFITYESDDFKLANDEHREILAACIARDVERAVLATQAHVRRIGDVAARRSSPAAGLLGADRSLVTSPAK